MRKSTKMLITIAAVLGVNATMAAPMNAIPADYCLTVCGAVPAQTGSEESLTNDHSLVLESEMSWVGNGWKQTVETLSTAAESEND